MKKLFLISAAFVFAMFGLFTSCSDDGGSDDPSVSSTYSVKVQKGSAISASVTVDLSDSSLNSTGIEAFSVGQDVTDLFIVSQVTSARAAVNTSNVTDFKATVSAVSATSLSVTLSGTAPSADCKIVAAIAIPAEYTEANEAVVKNAAVINVGEVSEDVADNYSCSLSAFTKITDISDLNGKILESSLVGWDSYGDNDDDNDDDGPVKIYYVFSKDSVTEYEYYYSSKDEKLKSVHEDEDITFEDGKLSYKNEDSVIGTIYSKDGKYYIIDDEEEDEVFPRKSGSGLCAT